MRVKVDEARCHHEPGGIDRPLGGDRSFAHRDDLSVSDADVSYGVEAGFGIRDAAAAKNDLDRVDAGLIRDSLRPRGEC